MQALIFLVVVMLVLGPLHYFLWRRLVRDTTHPGRWRKIGTAVFLALVLSLVAALVLPRAVGARAGYPITLVGYLWLAVMFYLFVLLLVLELPRQILLRTRWFRATGSSPAAASAHADAPADAQVHATAAHGPAAHADRARQAAHPADASGDHGGHAPSRASAGHSVITTTAGADGITSHADRDRRSAVAVDYLTNPAQIPATRDAEVTEPSHSTALGHPSSDGDPVAAGGDSAARDDHPAVPGGSPDSHRGDAAQLSGDPGRAGGEAGPLSDNPGAGGEPEALGGMSRRLLLTRGAAIFAGLTATGVTAYGARKAAGPPVVKRIQVPLAKLPRSMDGYRIAVVADVHIGPLTSVDHTHRIVDAINGTGADLITMVGDICDGTAEELHDEALPLRTLRSRDGVYYVTGNHEYYSGVDAWLDEVRSLGMRPLLNERLSIRGLDLAGVNDVTGEQFDTGPDYAKALGDRDPAKPVILLAHQPVMAYEAAKYDVDLQLSGHTHGGQLWPFHYLVKVQQPVVSGLGEVDGTKVYVTNGAGFWGPPVRVGAPPDITLVELRAG